DLDKFQPRGMRYDLLGKLSSKPANPGKSCDVQQLEIVAGAMVFVVESGEEMDHGNFSRTKTGMVAWPLAAGNLHQFETVETIHFLQPGTKGLCRSGAVDVQLV